VAQRQRDQRAIAFRIQIEFQLLAPGAAVAHQRAVWTAAVRLSGVQRLVQLAQRLQAVPQHRLVRPVARIGAVQQRHMPGLAGQHRQSDDAQIAPLALGLAAPRQFPAGGGGDVRVEVGGVECQHVGRQLEALDGGAGNGDLGILQLRRRDPSGQPVKGLPGEGRSRQAGGPRHTGFQEFRQVAFRRRGTRALDGNREHHLADRRTGAPRHRSAGPIDELDQVELLGHPKQRSRVTDASRSDRAD